MLSDPVTKLYAPRQLLDDKVNFMGHTLARYLGSKNSTGFFFPVAGWLSLEVLYGDILHRHISLSL